MRYTLFGRYTGLRVSELVLGGGVFGTRWGHGAEPAEVRRIVDAYVEAGGNFIDTANGYEFGESEEFSETFFPDAARTSCLQRNLQLKRIPPPGFLSLEIAASR